MAFATPFLAQLITESNIIGRTPAGLSTMPRTVSGAIAALRAAALDFLSRPGHSLLPFQRASMLAARHRRKTITHAAACQHLISTFYLMLHASMPQSSSASPASYAPHFSPYSQLDTRALIPPYIYFSRRYFHFAVLRRSPFTRLRGLGHAARTAKAAIEPGRG